MRLTCLMPNGGWKSMLQSHWRLLPWSAGSVLVRIVVVQDVFSFIPSAFFAKTLLGIFALQFFVIAWCVGTMMFSRNVELGFPGWSRAVFIGNLKPDYSDGENFTTVFAVLFPAVTGIMTGANMSGDLKEPSKAIPKGTLLAVIISFFFYAFFSSLLGATIEKGTLRLEENRFILQDISLFPPLITMGIMASVLSSAMGAIIGASRVLQALAKDELISILKPFAVLSGSRRDEPRRAVLLTWLLCQACLFIGSYAGMG